MHDIFVYNENQKLILETVRRFVEEEVKPRAAELDAQVDPEKSFSWEIVERANAVGIRTMTLDEKMGRSRHGFPDHLHGYRGTRDR